MWSLNIIRLQNKQAKAHLILMFFQYPVTSNLRATGIGNYENR